MLYIYDQSDAGNIHSMSSLMQYNITDPVSGKKCFTAQGQHAVIHFYINAKNGKHYGIGDKHSHYFVKEEELKEELRNREAGG